MWNAKLFFDSQCSVSANWITIHILTKYRALYASSILFNLSSWLILVVDERNYSKTQPPYWKAHFTGIMRTRKKLGLFSRFSISTFFLLYTINLYENHEQPLFVTPFNKILSTKVEIFTMIIIFVSLEHSK